MTLPPAILELENRNIGFGGEPTLGQALELAVQAWRSGDRGRELRLHILFLTWYCMVEPPHLTGHDEDEHVLSRNSPGLFSEVYETFAPTIDDDPECLFVVGYMAMIAAWALGGDEAVWEARSDAFQLRYRQLLPDGFGPEHFEGRGAYGHYFAGLVAGKSGS